MILICGTTRFRYYYTNVYFIPQDGWFSPGDMRWSEQNALQDKLGEVKFLIETFCGLRQA